jgi:hypothetical protein
MTDPKHSATDVAARDWSAEQLYDIIMYEIEPELLSTMIPLLPDLYRGESASQHEARMERYRQAFRIFTERFEKLLVLWKGELEKFRKEVFREVEAKVQAEEGRGPISRIEDPFPPLP